MLHKLKMNTFCQLLFAVIPLVFSLMFIPEHNWYFLAAAFLSSYILTGLLPACRKRENIWLFVFMSAAVIPADIYLSITGITDFMYGEPGYIQICFIVIFAAAVFSIVQIIFGVIARLIWRRQYTLKRDPTK